VQREPSYVRQNESANEELRARAAAEEANRKRAFHQQVARNRASRFYQTEIFAGSSNVYVSETNITLNDPEPITGWTGRFRSTGSAHLIYSSGTRGGQQSTDSSFEVITEEKSASKIEAVDFTRKS